MDKLSHNAIGKDYRLWHTNCAVVERGVAGFWHNRLSGL